MDRELQRQDREERSQLQKCFWTKINFRKNVYNMYVVFERNTLLFSGNKFLCSKTNDIFGGCLDGGWFCNFWRTTPNETTNKFISDD